MDLAGLGDSGTRPGRPDDEVFPPAAIDDIRAAIDFIRTRYGVRDISLAGLCSGAYHALRAAAAAVPANRILMINPQNYYWKEGMKLNDMQAWELVSKPDAYRSRMFSLSTWRRLLTGQVDVAYIAQIYFQSVLLALESFFRDMARRTGVRLQRDLGWELEEIVARGVRVVFVFARGEPGIGLLQLQAGSTIERLGERCHLHIIDNADHVFTQSGPREVLESILSDELFARGEWSTKG
jgi:pimeloyl-ACP methyl ester carboxylesterase